MIDYTARNGKLYKLPEFDTSKLQDGDLEILKKARSVLWDTETWEGYGTKDEKLLRSNYICNCILIATGFSKDDHYRKEKTEGTAAERLIELVEDAMWKAGAHMGEPATSFRTLYPQKSKDELYEIRNAWLEQIINSVEAPKPSYATGAWVHLVGDGQEREFRIVIELAAGKVIAAQSKEGLQYQDAKGERLADLEESVITVNDAHKDPEAWGLEVTDSLPQWAK